MRCDSLMVRDSKACCHAKGDHSDSGGVVTVEGILRWSREKVWPARLPHAPDRSSMPVAQKGGSPSSGFWARWFSLSVLPHSLREAADHMSGNRTYVCMLDSCKFRLWLEARTLQLRLRAWRIGKIHVR